MTAGTSQALANLLQVVPNPGSQFSAIHLAIRRVFVCVMSCRRQPRTCILHIRLKVAHSARSWHCDRSCTSSASAARRTAASCTPPSTRRCCVRRAADPSRYPASSSFRPEPPPLSPPPLPVPSILSRIDTAAMLTSSAARNKVS